MKTVFILGAVLASLFTVKAEAASCREGQREIFLESEDGSGEGMSQVHYVCRNGRFVKLFPDHRDHQPRHAPRFTCREGQREIFHEDDGSGDHMRPVHYVCRNGRFVRRW